MRRISFILLLILSVSNIYGQEISEKVCFYHTVLKCHFCGIERETTLPDLSSIKNSEIYQKASVMSIIQLGINMNKGENDICNGSRNGKHTFNTLSKKRIYKTLTAKKSNGVVNTDDRKEVEEQATVVEEQAVEIEEKQKLKDELASKIIGCFQDWEQYYWRVNSWQWDKGGINELKNIISARDELNVKFKSNYLIDIYSKYSTDIQNNIGDIKIKVIEYIIENTKVPGKDIKGKYIRRNGISYSTNYYSDWYVMFDLNDFKLNHSEYLFTYGDLGFIFLEEKILKTIQAIKKVNDCNVNTLKVHEELLNMYGVLCRTNNSMKYADLLYNNVDERPAILDFLVRLPSQYVNDFKNKPIRLYYGERISVMDSVIKLPSKINTTDFQQRYITLNLERKLCEALLHQNVDEYIKELKKNIKKDVADVYYQKPSSYGGGYGYVNHSPKVTEFNIADLDNSDYIRQIMLLYLVRAYVISGDNDVAKKLLHKSLQSDSKSCLSKSELLQHIFFYNEISSVL